MKKICLAIVTLAALSSVAYAHNRSYELRDSDTYFGKYSTQLKEKAWLNSQAPMTVVVPFAVKEKTHGLTNYQRMMLISEENDRGRQ